MTPRLKTLSVAKLGAGIKVPEIATLVDKRRNEAKVIEASLGTIPTTQVLRLISGFSRSSG